MKKLLLSALIVCLDLIIINYTSSVFDVEDSEVVYVLFYIIYGLYVLCGIWRKPGLTGEFLFLLPLWRITGLFKNDISNYRLRKKLLVYIAPPLFLTFFIPTTLACFYEHSERDNLCSILLALPIFCWIFFLVFMYAKEWLKTADKDKNPKILS